MPAKTPPDVIAKLNADTNAALAFTAVKLRFADLGAVPKGSTPAELAGFLQSEIAKWGPVITEARIKVDN
jgi:tripartite-type tricarboxylate transporter receptor subunit TctC